MKQGDYKKLKYKNGDLVRVVKSRFSDEDFSGSVPNCWVGNVFKVKEQFYYMSESFSHHEWKEYRIEPFLIKELISSRDKSITGNRGDTFLSENDLVQIRMVYEHQIEKVTISLSDISYLF